MKQLKLSIKPKQEPTEGQSLNSSGYSVKINDWELGRGVTDFKLEMSADKKPKATVTFTPDVIETNGVVADPQVLEAFDRAYSDFIVKTQNEKEQSEQELQDIAESLTIKDILENLLIYSKELKQNDFHSKIIISADGVYLEQTKEFHPLDETLLD